MKRFNINKITIITKEEHDTLKEKLKIYLKKMNTRGRFYYYFMHLNKLLAYLDTENVNFKSLNIEVFQEWYSKQRSKNRFLKEFLIKEKYIILDTNNKHNPKAVPFPSYIDAYIDYKKISDIRPRSIVSYVSALIDFNRFLEKQNINEISLISRDTVEVYLYNQMNVKNEKTGKVCKVKTAQAKLYIIRDYFRYLMKKDYISYNPTERFKKMRIEQELRTNFLNKKELVQFFNDMPIPTIASFRNKMLFLLMYACALRIEEAAHIKELDIDFENNMLTVTEGKGGYQRTVPLCNSITGYLKDYIEYMHRKKYISKTGYIFMSFPHNDRHVCTNSVHYAMRKQYAILLKEKKITSHAFRHSIAKHLLENGMNIRYVQKFLGHRCIDNTAVYTKLDIRELRKALSSFHPRELENAKSHITALFRGEQCFY